MNNLAKFDPRTGIQRVTRALLLTLEQVLPPGWRLEPVRREGDAYVYARRFMAALSNQHSSAELVDDPVLVGPADLFLNCELALEELQRDGALLAQGQGWLNYHRLRGLRTYYVVYDILALRFPHFFAPFIGDLFQQWITVLPKVADGVICISRAVREDLRDYLAAMPDLPIPPLGYFHLGADIAVSAPSSGMSAMDRALIERLRPVRFFLMVGTVEVRKSHCLVVDAMDCLWRQGGEAALVIVGKPGWLVEDLIERLNTHPERGQRLFWLDKVSDELLSCFYETASALIFASEAEGFGLPIIEAAQHGLPVICRDLPVYREVAGSHASYFTASDGERLAEHLARWLDDAADGRVPQSRDMAVLSWRDSAQMLWRWIEETEAQSGASRLEEPA